MKQTEFDHEGDISRELKVGGLGGLSSSNQLRDPNSTDFILHYLIIQIKFVNLCLRPRTISLTFLSHLAVRWPARDTGAQMKFNNAVLELE